MSDAIGPTGVGPTGWTGPTGFGPTGAGWTGPTGVTGPTGARASIGPVDIVALHRQQIDALQARVTAMDAANKPLVDQIKKLSNQMAINDGPDGPMMRHALNALKTVSFSS